MRTGESHCVRYYNKLGPFTKLATSYEVNLRGGQPIMPQDLLQGSDGDAFCQTCFPEYPLTYLVAGAKFATAEIFGS
jgi:hypothetical protein